MSNEKVEITVSISKETYDKLNHIANYFNGINKLTNKSEPKTDVENLIKGSVVKLIEEYDMLLYPLVIKDHELNGDGKLKNNFKKLIREDGLRQLDISQLTGIDKGTLSQIFNNHHQPTIDSFLRIWAVLGFPSIGKCFYRE